jgi:hypothetical protein
VTAQQAINAAMTHLGALTQGESPATSESNDFLQILNDMMSSWSTERLNIFSIMPSTHSLVSGTGSYTIGSSGVFNVTRPVRYERATIILPNTGGSGNRYHPLQIVDAPAWADILERSIGAVIPTVMFPDMAFPLTTLYLWPVPTFTTISVSLELWTWTQLTTFADLSRPPCSPWSACNAKRPKANSIPRKPPRSSMRQSPTSQSSPDESASHAEEDRRVQRPRI